MSALLLRDRVKETTTTTGTGALTLAGAATGYQAFSVAGDGARCRFCTEDGTNWEIAEGIYTASGTTLTRATIIASSNGGAAVSWSAGSKNVFLVADASFMAGLPSISASTAAPTNPRDNDLWFKTDEGSLKIYYNDGDSSQWIDLMAGQPLVGGIVRIGKVVCVGGETSVVFNNIPQTFSDLRLVAYGRDTSTSVTEAGFRLGFNGDTTSGNYTVSQLHQGLGGTNNTASTIAASSAGGVIGSLPGTSGNANAVGEADVLIPAYTQTSFYKLVRSVYSDVYGATPSLDTANITFAWKSTAAITSLTITAATTAFAAGTTFTLYGLG